MLYAVDEAGQEWEYDEAGLWHCHNTGETMDDYDFRLENPQIGAVERYRSALGSSAPARSSKGEAYVPASGASYKQRTDSHGNSHRNYGGSWSRNNRATRR
ncbi:hypothetical protein BDZ45DRAFT_742814 [Acephala macrosclerotiorum]|nr:hypothetical protein BDZ45DRAFT_742814 [Acephala macrosclerotiorum]